MMLSGTGRKTKDDKCDSLGLLCILEEGHTTNCFVRKHGFSYYILRPDEAVPSTLRYSTTINEDLMTCTTHETATFVVLLYYIKVDPLGVISDPKDSCLSVSFGCINNKNTLIDWIFRLRACPIPQIIPVLLLIHLGSSLSNPSSLNHTVVRSLNVLDQKSTRPLSLLGVYCNWSQAHIKTVYLVRSNLSFISSGLGR